MQIELLWILISSLAIMLASFAGVFFISKKLGAWMHSHIGYFISFSAGVFLIISIFMAREALHMTGSVLNAILAIAGGALIAFIISLIMPEQHAHQDEDCCEHHNKKTAYKMMLGDGIHNIADGFLLVPAFLVDLELGILTAVGIFVHEFVQEVSEFFIFKEAGYKSGHALLINFVISSTILIGVILGLVAVQSDIIIGTLIGIASGIFLYAVVADLIPKSTKSATSKKVLLAYLGLALAGALVITAINSLSGHEQAHDQIHEHAYEHEDGNDEPIEEHADHDHK